MRGRPFFRRFRLSLSNTVSNNGTWVLRVSDRNTGEERCKFTGLRVYTPSGVPQYRVGSANGHLLLNVVNQAGQGITGVNVDIGDYEARVTPSAVTAGRSPAFARVRIPSANSASKPYRSRYA